MTDTAISTQSSTSSPSDPLIVITSDSHVSPVLETQLRSYCPQKHLEGFDDWMSQTKEEREARRSGFVFGGDESLPEIQEIQTWNLQTDGAFDINARLRDMNRDGVAGEVIFHGSAPFDPIPFMQSGIGTRIDRLELSAMGERMYNAWLADFCSVEPERHVGLAQLPMWDIEAAINELEWARNAGLRGVNFPQCRAELLPYEDPAWDRFWSACEDFDMPLANHGGGGASTPPATGPMALHIYMAESNALSRVSPVVRLVFGGVFERHPKLKLIQTEQQGFWYAQVLGELDSRWLAFRRQIGDVSPNRRLPSEYCRDQYFVGASFQSRYEAESTIAEGYVANMMWGSDYPHPEGTFHYPRNPDDTPMTHLAMRNTYAGLPADPVRSILGENAVRVYGFDADKLRNIANRINAPTPEELSHPLEERPTHWGFAFRTSKWLI